MGQFRDFAEEAFQINALCEALDVVHSEIDSPDCQFTRRARNALPALIEHVIARTWALAEALEDAEMVARADEPTSEQIADAFLKHTAKVAAAKYDAGLKT